MVILEGAGVPLAVEVTGDGPPVLLVHGIGETRHAWAPIAGARTIAYDRRGYGDSGAPERYAATTIAEQAEDALAVLEAVEATDVVAAGSDFGALVILDLLMRHPDRIRCAVLIDPAAFPLVPEATEALSQEVSRVSAGFREDGADATIARLRRERGLPPAAQTGNVPAFFADLAGQSTLELTRRSLRTITTPVTILVHDAAPAYVRDAAEMLAELTPDAELGVGEDLRAAAQACLA